MASFNAYELLVPGDDGGHCEGVVILDESGVPLPVDARGFEDAEDAERFLQWLQSDPRLMEPRYLREHASRWAEVREWAECHDCERPGDPELDGLCSDCHCDRVFEAEQAARRAS